MTALVVLPLVVPTALLHGGAAQAAMLAALAVALLVRRPPAAVTGQPVGSSDSRVEGSTSPWWSRLRARPDATPLRLRLLASGGAAAGLGLALQGQTGTAAGWFAMAPVAVAGVVLLGRLEPARARQPRRRLVLDLPHALELLSACLASGLPLRRATAAVAEACDGPASEDLQQVLAMVELGVGDADAWLTLRHHPLWGPAAVDLARSVESGTMMVEVLVHHARDARARRRAAMEIAAKAVGVRSVLPLMTCFLPAFVLVGVIPTVASAVLHALSWG